MCGVFILFSVDMPTWSRIEGYWLGPQALNGQKLHFTFISNFITRALLQAVCLIASICSYSIAVSFRILSTMYTHSFTFRQRGEAIPFSVRCPISFNLFFSITEIKHGHSLTGLLLKRKACYPFTPSLHSFLATRVPVA